MSLNQENFEKLEAYLDGALSAAERADLDRQLASNPQLRKMMDELALTRTWVAQLPRASAPPDIVETFQGQLERDALLGESGEQDTDVVLRINQWPHFMSVAAIVLLAFGLALVIYKVLPNKKINSVAVTSPAGPEMAENKATAPTNEKDVESLRDDSRVEIRKDAMEHDQSRVTIAPRVELPIAPMTPAKAAPTTSAIENGATDAMAKRSAADRPQVTPEEVRETQLRMARAGKPAPDAKFDAESGDGVHKSMDAVEDNGPVVLLVNAQDPRQASQDVSDFLNRNGITYVADAATRASAIPSAASNYSGNSYQFGNGTQSAAGGAPATQEVITKQEAANLALGNRASGGGGGGGAGNYGTVGNSTQQAPAPSSANGLSLNGGNYNNNNDRGGMNQTQVANGPQTITNNGVAQSQNNTLTLTPAGATQPSVSDPSGHNGSVTVNGGVISGLNTTNNTLSLGGSTASAYRGTANGTYRAMLTSRQQSELNDYIARRGNQWAERRTELQAALKPPSESTPVAMDKAKTEAPVTGEKEGVNAPSAPQPATQPMAIDAPAVASRSTPGQEATKKVAAAPLPTQPTTLGDEQREMVREKSVAPASAPTAAAGPTTSPLSRQLAATNPADEPHEVLIVVNDQPIILPTALPLGAASTQPATQPAAPTTVPANDAK